MTASETHTEFLNRPLAEFKPYGQSYLKTVDLIEGRVLSSEANYMDQVGEAALQETTLENYIQARGGLEDAIKKIRSSMTRSELKFHGRILEFGAGNAKFSAELSKIPEVQEIHCMDISKPLIFEIAPRIVSYLGGDLSKITFYRSDMNDLELMKEKYDFIVSYGVLHHLFIPEHFFNFIDKNLKNNGIVFCAHEPAVPEYIFPGSLKDSFEKIRKLRVEGTNENIYAISQYINFIGPKYNVRTVLHNRFRGIKKVLFKLFGQTFFDSIFMVDFIMRRKPEVS